MLDALLLVAAVAAAPAPARPAEEPTPSIELLEFIGTWSEEEAAQFLDAADANRKTAATPPPEPDDDR